MKIGDEAISMNINWGLCFFAGSNAILGGIIGLLCCGLSVLVSGIIILVMKDFFKRQVD